MNPFVPRDVIHLLQLMVQCNSVNTWFSSDPLAELPLALAIEQLARDWGLATQQLPIEGRCHNLLITCPASEPDAPWLLFDSHLDTVGVAGMADPFGGRLHDDRIHGRGSCDTKGTGAAMLWALREYLHLPQRPNHIALLMPIDEECTKLGVRVFAQQQLPALGWQPVGAIVGEPTMLRAVTAHNGSMRFDVTTHGRACHSSDPSCGANAIAMMAHVVQAIEQHYIANLRISYPLTGQAQCSINMIEGGSAINIIPDRCTVRVDRRLVPDEDSQAVLPAVQRVLDQLTSTQPWIQTSITPRPIDPPLSPPANPAFANAVCRTLAGLGLPSEPAGMPYGTDASTLATAASIPAIVLGPGDIARAHTDNEWLAVDQLLRSVEVYGTLMRCEY